jgi:hypothetical protein
MAQAAAPVALSELQEETRMERESRASAVDSAGARGGFGWRLAAERGNTSQCRRKARSVEVMVGFGGGGRCEGQRSGDMP